MSFITADQAKVLSNVANLNIEMYKPRLAQLIEDNSRPTPGDCETRACNALSADALPAAQYPPRKI